MQRLRVLLQTFVDDTNAAPLIKSEACKVLLVGFTLFFPSPQEQAALLLELLEGGARLSPGRAQLRELLLDQLPQWSGASAIFLMAPAVASADQMAVDAPKPGVVTQPIGEAEKQAYRLVFALVDTCVDEATRTINAIGSGAPPQLRLSAALRLLLVLQRDLAASKQYRAQFLRYACELLQKARVLLDLAASKSPKTHVADALKCTVVGIVLQSLAVTLCRKPLVQDVTFVTELLPALRKLISTLDQLTHLLPETAAADQLYLARLGRKEPKRVVVETKHPYPHGKNQLKETVTFPGAEALSLRFDSRSATANAGSDLLQMFKNDQLSEAVANTTDGNPLFFSGKNWPCTPLHIPGDTVTFLFTATTRADPLASVQPQRFGFRCVVSPVAASSTPAEPLLTHWLLDLENSLAQLSVRCAKSLVAGEPFSPLELRAMSWLNSPLLRGGLETAADATPTATTKWVDELLAGTGSGAALYEWMKAQTRGTRPQASAESIQHVETAERHLIAAILKHTGLLADAVAFSALLLAAKNPASNSHEQLFAVADVACGVARQLAYRAQVLSKWQRAANEEPSSFDWSLDHATLRDLAVFKGVDSGDKDLVQQLTDKLRQEFSLRSDAPLPNAYELVSRPLIDRAKLLLRVKTPTPAEAPAAEKANPFALHRPASLMQSSDDNGRPSERDMLRSMSAFHETEALQQRSRKKALEELKTKAFSRRVKELRNWLSAYKGWRRLIASGAEDKKDLPPQNPLAAVAAFVESANFSSEQVQGLIKVHRTRAASRTQGLSFICELLELHGFASVRHQVLGAATSLFHNGHYLDHVQSAGGDLVRQVRAVFAQLFEQVARLLQVPGLDPVSKTLALGIFAMRYAITCLV